MQRCADTVTEEREERLRKLCEALKILTDGQTEWLRTVIKQFQKPYRFSRHSESDIITDCILQDFGDGLRIHHCFSREAFTKDKFEYALERVANFCGSSAKLAPKGNPGHDITINGNRFSLKTQADKNLKIGYLHISKFMELGKGEWSDKEEDLIGLREQFFHHMRNYDRILSLRRLPSRKKKHLWCYELVEIPKSLLEEAQNGNFFMRHESTQLPKPGYCCVTDETGKQKFQLYFDGGGERKLQIKALDKSLCIVHAEWEFETEDS